MTFGVPPLGGQLRTPPEGATPNYNAAAPETISMISRVIAA
jgi:hypothetical protein